MVDNLRKSKTLALPPEFHKVRGIGGCVANRILNVAMAEIVLNQPSICPLVGQGIAAGHSGLLGQPDLSRPQLVTPQGMGSG